MGEVYWAVCRMIRDADVITMDALGLELWMDLAPRLEVVRVVDEGLDPGVRDAVGGDL
jgi:hypothetical protein